MILTPEARAEKRIRKDERLASAVRALDSLFNRKLTGIYRGQQTRAKNCGMTVQYTLAQLGEKAHAALDLKICPYTGAKLQVSQLVADHDCPVSRGGKFTLGNTVICSATGNGRKGCMTGNEYERLRAVIDTFDPAARSEIWAKLRQRRSGVR